MYWISFYVTEYPFSLTFVDGSWCHLTPLRCLSDHHRVPTASITWRRSPADDSESLRGSPHKQVGCFLFGCAISQSFTDIAKVSIGRLRPHFLNVCNPDFSQINCSVGYIQNYKCRGEDSKVQEARWESTSRGTRFTPFAAGSSVEYLLSTKLSAGALIQLDE